MKFINGASTRRGSSRGSTTAIPFGSYEQKSFEFRLGSLLSETDHYTNSFFEDDDGDRWSVEKVYRYAEANHEPIDFPISKLVHDLDWWEDSPEQRRHMRGVDISFPLLVIRQDDGHLSVADGLNRLKKATGLNLKIIKVFILDIQEITALKE